MKGLEEFVSKAKEAVGTIGEKAEKIASVSKLNFKVMEKKSELKHELESLGKVVYENYNDGLENKSEIELEIQNIKKLYEEIEKLKIEIAYIKNKILCKACGKHNEAGSLFCSKCGEDLKNEGTPIVENADEDDDFVEFDD